MDQVGLEVADRNGHDPLHVFAISGVHEIDAFAKRLVAIHYRPPEVPLDKPVFGFWLLVQEGLIGDGAAHVDANTNAVLLAQIGQTPGVRHVLLFGFQTVSLIKVDHGHGDAEFFQLKDRLFGMLPRIVFFLPCRGTAHATAEDGHTIPVADNHERFFAEP